MGGENRYITNQEPSVTSGDLFKSIQIGTVVSVDDPQSLGRIKVRINGPATMGGDDGISDNNLSWCYPMVPKFFSSLPKVTEGVFILTFGKNKSHSDRLYFGPIISQLNNLNIDSINSTGLSSFTFLLNKPNVDFNTIPALRGVFPKTEDVAIQGRYNTDIILRKNEILFRAGKFVESKPNENNNYSFQFNNETQGFILIRNNVPLEKPKQNTTQSIGSVTNIVGNKINLLTHKDGTPRFNIMNQDDQISNDEILNILENAHPLPFGDLLVQYLKLLKIAFLNHVHNGNGKAPTDLVTDGNQLPVDQFKKIAEDLENRMLSKNIRIN